MTTNSTSTVGSSSFLNLFGIFVSIVLCVLFIILGGHTLKYIKEFAVKIKIIANRAQDKNVQLKDFNYQGQEDKKRTPAFEKMEQVYKNEIKKSRSLHFGNIFKSYIAKYDHVIYYPFRDKIAEQYDLLKPKTTFYTLLVICTCCVAWMTTIFLSSILESAYSNVTLIPTSTFVGLTVAIAIISSLLNIIATNRLFRIYLINIKSAFKVDYGHRFIDAYKGLKEYEPENSQEEEELFKHQSMLENGGYSSDLNRKGSFSGRNGPGQITDQQTQRTMREETLVHSTRKLLGEEFEKSDKQRPFQIQQEQTVIEERNDEDIEDKRDDLLQKDKAPRKRVAIKDVFPLQVGIEGVEDADPDTKYIYIEDKDAIGDEDLLNNEANKGDNNSNVTTFMVLFIIIAVAAAVCCYLNYNFSKTLAQAVFYMFIGGFLGDILISRPLLLLLLSLIKYSNSKAKGYNKIEYKNSKDIKDLMGKAIKDMFEQRKKMREYYKTGNSSWDQQPLGLGKNEKTSQHQLSGFDNLSHEDIMNQDYLTQNGFERNETKTYQANEENKEDDFAQVVSQHKDDDLDGQGIPMIDLKKAFHPTDFARPKIEQEQKNFDQTQNLAAFNTHVPLISNLQKAVRDKEDEKYSSIMERKQLVNELADYNLLLLRKIYDAYEERAEKVLKNFRSDNNGVLRKRYMVPILNPNYDYEKLLREMQDAGKGALKDLEEEESVHLDGVTVCEDSDKQLMEAIIQETSDDLVGKRIDRQKIDKFGNPVDEEKLRNGVKKACPAPAYDKIEMSNEETIEEDDEEGRKRRLLEQLRQRLANGEELTAEELAMLEELENQRLAELDRLIKELLSKGFENLIDQEKLTLISYQKERLNIMLDQILRKKSLSEQDHLRIKEIKDELKRLEYEELLLKRKMGIITAEELERLLELEREYDMLEIENLRKKMLEGTITEEELRRLRELESQYSLEHLKNPFEKVEEEQIEQVEEQKEEVAQEEVVQQEQQQEPLVEEQQLIEEPEKQQAEEEEEEPFESEHSRITDQDNFAELPPVQVMNNLSKPQSPEKDVKNQKQLDDLEQQKLLQDQQDNLGNNTQTDQNVFDQNLMMLSEQEREKQLQQEQLRSQEEERLRKEREAEEARLREEEQFHFKEEQEKFMQEQEEKRQHLELEEYERLERQRDLEEEQQRLKEEEEQRQREIEEMERLQQEGTLSEQEQEELRKKQEEQELLRQQQEELLRQQEQEELLREQQEEEKLRLDEEERQKEQEMLQRQKELEEQERLRAEEFNQMDQSALGASEDIIHEKRSGSSDEEGMSRLGSRKQNRLNSQLDQNLEDEDIMRGTNNKFMDPDYAFGHDDLEFEKMNAPAGANGEEESIYSHKTTTILDEEKVSFMHIDQLPNQDNASEDSFSEQDMVYYNKDDLTNYSKGLGLNKVRAKQPGQNYFSENDLQEVQEREFSDHESSRRSGRSLDYVGGSRMNQYGRGKLNHNDLEMQENGEYVEGRVKVDAWNLNYRGKKKKLRKKKATDAQKRKMDDLQNIYGIDAKTLAGLSKGRLPRQLIASGKLKGDGPNDSRIGSDMSFRSTQNTFLNKNSTAAKSRMKQSINDAQSNMFSFNGYGTSKRWNEIESTLKGGPRESRQDLGASQFDQRSVNNRFPVSGIKKMTATQENFQKLKGLNNGARGGNNNDFLEEESKSGNSGSRGGSLARRFNGPPSNNSKNLNSSKNLGPKGKKGGNKSGKNGSNSKKNNRRLSSDGMDSHSESDEAVDDKGAMFQKRNDPWNMNARGNAFGGMNDNASDHSESEEGNNQDNPDFGGNQFVFKKRPMGEQNALSQVKNNKGKIIMFTKCFTIGAWSNAGQNKKKGARGSGDDLNVEDLEAQSISGKKGRKGTQNNNKKAKGQRNGADNRDMFGQDSFRRNGSAERDDSEEENLGGDVMFQKRNQIGDYQLNDAERMNRAEELSNNGMNRSQSNNMLNKSSSKPPLSGQKRQGARAGGQGIDNQGINGDFNNMPGNVKANLPSNISDNENRMRNTFNDSDNDGLGSSHQKRGGLFGTQTNLMSNGRNSNPEIYDPSHGRQQNRKHSRMHNRSINDGLRNSDNEGGENDYIVGPESNHSSMRKRPFRGSQRSNEEDDRYMLMQRERQIIEDIESDRQGGGMNNSKLAKKRKIRKAAHSQNPRDLQSKKFQEMQNERLRKKQREAEAALFAKGDDLEKGQAKMKKKKVKKDWVKKEVNYWLDYDSPYAEYLVARFREWSPNPNIGRGASANNGGQRSLSNKYKEVQNVYSKGPDAARQGSSKQNSRSRERRLGNDGGSMLNVTQQKKGGNKKQGLSSQNSNQFKAAKDVNTLFVDDYEEP